MTLVTLTAVCPPIQFLMTVFIRWVEKCTTVSVIRLFSEALWTFRTRSEGEEMERWSGWDKDVEEICRDLFRDIVRRKDGKRERKAVTNSFGKLWDTKLDKEKKYIVTSSWTLRGTNLEKEKKYIVTSFWTLRGTNLERENKYIVTCFGISLGTKLEGEKKTMKTYSEGNWQFGICDCYFPNKITECYQHNASHRFCDGTLNVSEYLL